MISTTHLLSDDAVRQFIVDGHLAVRTELPRAFHQACFEKILRHLKLWPEHAESARLSRAPPSGNSERNVEPYFDDLPAVSATQSLQAGPFPDYPVTIPRPRDHVERQ